MDERTGEAFEAGEQLTVVGQRLRVGEPAPEFVLDEMSPEDGSIGQVSMTASHGQVLLLNVINSIDTPVCSIETHTWQSRLPANGNRFRAYTVSMDLPFALDRWRRAKRHMHPMLSAHRSEQFGVEYGILLKEWRLLQRAVFVIDPTCAIAHAEYVADQMREPDYDAALACFNALLDS
ncbi:redoxin domain-containing protein [Streptomyces sioyaensis]|uniref:redoxin domain-containing protein n=1 Tax=Streptomyces sioyaensis TaxID=67364 RepID=UPI003409185F